METKTDHWELEILTDKIRTAIITLIVTGPNWERAQNLTMHEVISYSKEISKLFMISGYDSNVVKQRQRTMITVELRHQMSQAFTSGNVAYDILQCKEGEERLRFFTDGGES